MQHNETVLRTILTNNKLFIAEVNTTVYICKFLQLGTMKRKLTAFFRFFISKLFLINLGIGIIVFLLIGYFTLQYLDDYTRHDETVRIPNLVGLNIEEAPEILDPLGLGVVIDSVFIKGEEPGTIWSQYPECTDSSGIEAKEGRKLRLTIIRYTKPGKTIDPKRLKFRSKRVVMEYLISLGYDPKAKFVPSPDDYVLEIVWKGKPLTEPTSIPVGEQIVVEIGKGVAQRTSVPDLLGKTISDAKRSLGNSTLRLELRECTGCLTAEDSASAKVIRQDPMGGPESMAAAGSELFIWLSTEPDIEDPDEQDE